MKELLEQIAMVAKTAFTEWLPSYINAGLGIIGEFLDTIGYVKAIIIAIVGAIGIAIRWIWKKLNR